MADVRDKIFGLSGAARDTMRCLFFHGPTWDGNLPSKCGRGELVDAGYAERWNGWQWLTRAGVEFAINSLLMEREKEKWQNERRNAVHAIRQVSADGINLILSEAGVANSAYLAVKIAEAVESGKYT